MYACKRERELGIEEKQRGDGYIMERIERRREKTTAGFENHYE